MSQSQNSTADLLLLTPRDAAQTLAVCERSLWAMTAPRGPIPCVRIGRSVRYAIDDLRSFIERQKNGGEA